MNTRTKIAASTVTVGFTAAFLYGMHDYNKQLYGRFPDLDRKIVRKAFRKMMLNAIAQKYTDAQLSTDNAMDELFLAEYDKLKTA